MKNDIICQIVTDNIIQASSKAQASTDHILGVENKYKEKNK